MINTELQKKKKEEDWVFYRAIKHNEYNFISIYIYFHSNSNRHNHCFVK